MAIENGQAGEARKEVLPLEKLAAESSPGTDTGADSFAPLPKESARAFAAFRAYLEMGQQRTLAKAAEKLGIYHGVMEKWSSRFGWQARVKAQAAHLAEVERLAIEAVAREKAVEWDKMQETVRREAWREAEETIQMVRKARQEWLEKGRVPGWEGMARMLELAFKLKQFATGMTSEVKEVHTNVTGQLEMEWEVALQKAYGPKADDQVIDVETAPAAPQKEVAGMAGTTN